MGREDEYIASHVCEQILFIGTSSSLLHASQMDLESMPENSITSIEWFRKSAVTW